ncbi:nuclear receptor subfamily 2 group E member 1-like [Anthonomus grandis grandis]|uniref:nuclear receptor subfamily 2 group E member 1-like n=1 Tax=Anthonomus grandis grandis TaxID=2921223 RepID=UPI0021657F7D|nr:nuclear receptor subfamily 2 group E member 1-like [Anthonomus grandis grandis]
MEESVSCHKIESLCKVCGDKASGKHYGVASCDGCRGFFKRSIRRNLEYVCKESGRCIVDVTRRNQCQACRFKKCLQVNMKRDAVQHERAPRTTHPSIHHYPIGFTPRFRTLQQSSVFSSLPLHFPSASLLDHTSVSSPLTHGSYNMHHGLIYPNNLLGGQFQKPAAGLACSVLNPVSYLEKPQQYLKVDLSNSVRESLKDDEVSSSEEINKEKSNKEENPNIRLELPILNDTAITKPPNLIPLDISSLSVFAENVYESAAKLLFLAIKWAKTIPSFLQLSQRDQSILLEESWNELFILTAAQWSLPIDEVVLAHNANASTTRQTVLEEDARKLRDIISKLNLLRVDHTEHACLKALVLFKSDCRGLCEPTHVELLQDQTHVMLHEYCNQRQSHAKARFGKLLLTLPSIQSLPKKSLEELLFKQTVGDVAVDKLLGDVAKATYLNNS